ncbi:MAG: hypothetical protein NTU91_14365 [Chloroflexi bacterium]|nr:hypothetical protein [Chloroflexota bacterium]
MASGRPDYTSQSLMKGADSGTHRTVAVDSAGNILTLIKGQFGGAPVTIAVDAGGNILGILQGDYAGSLKTLAVDAQGRMLAVLTDPEDVFGNPHYMGSAELAARLGSPDCLERKGQVLFMDGGGVNVGQYLLTTSGASSAMVVDTTFGILGPKSYKLTAGPANGDYIKIEKRMPRISAAGLGLEACMCVNQNAKYVTLLILTSSRATLYTGAIQLDLAAAKIYYYDSSLGWTQLAAFPCPLQLTDAHLFKLTINSTLGKYMQFRWDLNTYDMSAIFLESHPVLGTQQISGSVQYDCEDHGDVSAYLGPLIITVNET